MFIFSRSQNNFYYDTQSYLWCHSAQLTSRE
nr:MAG TPA: hypothetical protein [Microviridae sp.]